MGNDGLKLEGFLDIEVVSKDKKVRRHYKNTITNAGKKFMLDKCAGRMLKIGGDIGGDIASHGSLDINTYYFNQYKQGKLSDNRFVLTNVLLNLSSGELTGLTGASTFISLYDSNLGIDGSKLIGYANSEPSAVSENTKQGITDACKGEYIIDGACVAKRWKYAAGIASGTVNAIAMMPADSVKTSYGRGVSTSKCLDIANLQKGETFSTGFCPPGIGSFTQDNEILLDTNSGRFKFNLTTGETTEVAASDPFWVFPSSLGAVYDWRIWYGKIYVLHSTANYGGAWNRNDEILMSVYDASTGAVVTSGYRVFRCDYYNKIPVAKFLEIGSTQYITLMDVGNNNSNTRAVALSWDGGVGYFTPTGTRYSDWSFLSSFNMPSLFLAATGIYSVDGNGFCIGQYDGDYLMYIATNPNREDIYNYNPAQHIMAIRFTDLSDVRGSIVDIISGLTQNSVPFSNSSFKGFLRTGYWYKGPTDVSNTSNKQYDLCDCREVVYNSANSSGIEVDSQQSGTYLTLDGWWTNVISFVKLSEPVQVGDNDDMYVSYGYRVV